MTFFHNLVQEGPFNVFVGAGISKSLPSCAPLWKEMFRDFVDSMFEGMEREGWSAASAFAAHKPKLLGFNFRPETFWELVAGEASLDLVCGILEVVNSGGPNLNHRLLALLASRGTIRNIVTTNIDEYIEYCLSGVVRPLIPPAIEAGNNGALKSRYFKVHGTLSMPETLQFTLTHTHQLPAEKARYLDACLTDFPLLIAGYSGNDNDIRPRLVDIVRRLPRVELIVHPGSPSDEPIRELASVGSNVSLREEDISSVFRKWVKGMASKDPQVGALLNEAEMATTSPKDHYANVLRTYHVALVPLLISRLFSFSGNPEVALWYAQICEDACEDPRYASDLPSGLLGRAFLQASQCYGQMGQAGFSRMFAKRAANAGIEKQSMASSFRLALSKGFSLLLNKELKEAELWILGACGIANSYFGTANQKLESCWCLGRLRECQGRFAEAVAAYQQIETEIDGLSQPRKGAFLLDFGSALVAYGTETGNRTAFENAEQLFSFAEAIARDAGDHVTRVKALMNLAQGNHMGGAVDLARRQIQKAQDCANRTGDFALQDRVAKLKAIICGEM